MSEHEQYDDLITDAIDSFLVAAAPSVRAAGTGAVRMTVSHRRKVRIMTLSVLGALLIAVPLVALAANPRGNNSPPPQPAASASPSVEPTPSRAAPPDGRLTAEQLVAGPIEVPAWGQDSASCPSGSRTPELPSADSGENDLLVSEVVHANLDDDSALETAVMLLCVSGDPSPQQVVAYDRDAGGKIILLGRIYGQVDDVDYTREIQARPEGGLSVNVCVGGCGSDPTDNQYQDRQYAWDGSKFVRVK